MMKGNISGALPEMNRRLKHSNRHINKIIFLRFVPKFDIKSTQIRHKITIVMNISVKPHVSVIDGQESE